MIIFTILQVPFFHFWLSPSYLPLLSSPFLPFLSTTFSHFRGRYTVHTRVRRRYFWDARTMVYPDTPGKSTLYIISSVTTEFYERFQGPDNLSSWSWSGSRRRGVPGKRDVMDSDQGTPRERGSFPEGFYEGPWTDRDLFGERGWVFVFVRLKFSTKRDGGVLL